MMVEPKTNGVIEKQQTGVVEETVIGGEGKPLKHIQKGRRFTRNKRQFKKKFIVERTAEREECPGCGNKATPMYHTHNNWM